MKAIVQLYHIFENSELKYFAVRFDYQTCQWTVAGIPIHNII